MKISLNRGEKILYEGKLSVQPSYKIYQLAKYAGLSLLVASFGMAAMLPSLILDKSDFIDWFSVAFTLGSLFFTFLIGIELCLSLCRMMNHPFVCVTDRRLFINYGYLQFGLELSLDGIEKISCDKITKSIHKLVVKAKETKTDLTLCGYKEIPDIYELLKARLETPHQNLVDEGHPNIRWKISNLALLNSLLPYLLFAAGVLYLCFRTEIISPFVIWYSAGIRSLLLNF